MIAFSVHDKILVIFELFIEFEIIGHFSRNVDKRFSLTKTA